MTCSFLWVGSFWVDCNLWSKLNKHENAILKVLSRNSGEISFKLSNEIPNDIYIVAKPDQIEIGDAVIYTNMFKTYIPQNEKRYIAVNQISKEA